MALIKAKCTNCGANLKVNKADKTGICEHCGAGYITEDIVVNNITNINYEENINGTKLDRQAVLENLLIEYYSGKFNDIDNIKEYALKVQEYDLNNALARFVVFNNIDSSEAIRKFLGSDNLNIGWQLFLLLLNISGDSLNREKIINNVAKYKDKMKASVIIEDISTKYNQKDFKFILSVIYKFKLSQDENTAVLDALYEQHKTNKITMLAQLKSFANKHSDFYYDKQKFSERAEYWKRLKEKQIALRKSQNEVNESIKIENKDIVDNSKNKRKKILMGIGVGLFLVGILLIIIGMIL